MKTETEPKMPLVLSSRGLCEHAKAAFEAGMRDGFNGEIKPRAAWKAATLAPGMAKDQRRVLRRVYEAAFKFQKRQSGQ